MISGLIFGLSAGAIPGPLMMATILAALQQGRKMALIVALMPLLAEFPVIALVAYTASVSLFPPLVITMIAVVGSCVLMWIGYSTIRANTKRTRTDFSSQALITPSKAFLIAFLNPNPYIFWLTAGIGFIQQEIARGGTALSFVIGFFIAFLSINIAVALGADWIKKYLNSVWYQRVVVSLGIIIIGLGIRMLVTAFL